MAAIPNVCYIDRDLESQASKPKTKRFNCQCISIKKVILISQYMLSIMLNVLCIFGIIYSFSIIYPKYIKKEYSISVSNYELLLGLIINVLLHIIWNNIIYMVIKNNKNKFYDSNYLVTTIGTLILGTLGIFIFVIIMREEKFCQKEKSIIEWLGLSLVGFILYLLPASLQVLLLSTNYS